MWCLFARRLGYDSIQVAHGIAYYQGGPRKGKRRPLAELIDCTTPCMEQSYSSDACVPVARGVSPDGSTVVPCACAKGQKGLSAFDEMALRALREYASSVPPNQPIIRAGAVRAERVA